VLAMLMQSWLRPTLFDFALPGPDLTPIITPFWLGAKELASVWHWGVCDEGGRSPLGVIHHPTL
jgi:hypothetical protein